MHLCILGNGIAGTTAALETRRLHPDWAITIVSEERPRPYSRPALMYVFMGQVRAEDCELHPAAMWAARRINLVQGRVAAIDVAGRRLRLDGGSEVAWDRLVLATGSVPRRAGWRGQDLRGVGGFYHWSDLERLEQAVPKARRAVIVGGGLIGVEVAEMFLSRGLAVTMFVREHHMWGSVLPREEGALVDAVVRAAGVDLRLGLEVEGFDEDGTGAVSAAVTPGGDRVPCEIVCLAVGVTPHVGMVRDSGIPVGKGVLVDASLRCGILPVWAAGDCAELPDGRGGTRIEQCWYTSRAQGVAVARAVAGSDEPYVPAPWFNSAKFFELEYQVYGQVTGRPDGSHLYIDLKRGHAIRFEQDWRGLVGIHALGLRLRQAACERAVKERWTVRACVDRLSELLFEPEFSWNPQQAVRAALGPSLS